MAKQEEAIYSYKEFSQDIKNGLKTHYIFYGEEDYIKNKALEDIRNRYCGDPAFYDFNVIRIPMADLDCQVLLDSFTQTPMMSDYKLVVITAFDPDLLKTVKSQAEDFISTMEQIDRMTDTCLVIVCGSDVTIKQSKKKATPKKANADGDGGTEKEIKTIWSDWTDNFRFVYFPKYKGAPLYNWIAKHFSKNGIKVDNDFCREMTEYCGTDLFTLTNEIDKLSHYLLANDLQIPLSEGMRTVCSQVIEEESEFDFTNALSEFDKKRMLLLLKNRKIKGDDPLMLFGSILALLCDMEKVAFASGRGQTDDIIAKDTGIHPFRIKKMRETLRKYGASRIRKGILICRREDCAFKTEGGSLDENYQRLEKIICSL